MKTQTSNFESLGKGELIALCDRLLTDDSDAVEECIAFIEAETMGLWHGRARAMMARRLKHCRLSQPQRTRAVRAILDRLVSGRFSDSSRTSFVLFCTLRQREHLLLREVVTARQPSMSAATPYGFCHMRHTIDAPNHPLQRTRPSRYCGNRGVSWAGPLSLGR